MVFVPHPGHLSAEGILTSSKQKDADTGDLGTGFETMIDQIAEAVRQKLIEQGLPPLAEDSHPLPPPVFTPDTAQPSSLASLIDHTLLKPEVTPEEIKKVCEEAKTYHFATVCVNSSYIGLVADHLKGSSVKPIAVVGFPLGAAATATKAFEAREAIAAGAKEIDMVINIGALKSRQFALVLEDIKQVVASCKPLPVKVILETSSLTTEEKIIACALSKAAGAAFVKTSTGFGSGGATEEDVRLMRNIVGPDMGVKASGGIRSKEDALRMIAAGANRLGTSAGVIIVSEGTENTGKKTDKPGTSTNMSKTSFRY